MAKRSPKPGFQQVRLLVIETLELIDAVADKVQTNLLDDVSFSQILLRLSALPIESSVFTCLRALCTSARDHCLADEYRAAGYALRLLRTSLRAQCSSSEHFVLDMPRKEGVSNSAESHSSSTIRTSCADSVEDVELPFDAGRCVVAETVERINWCLESTR